MSTNYLPYYTTEK